MILIAHRGNTSGPNKSMENKPEYINNALREGFHVEIDVWFEKDRLFLGHADPQYEVNLKFLQNNKLWCHAKNLSALHYMLMHNIHCFWHEEDNFTITSNGFIWTYPGFGLTKKSICVMPETIKNNEANGFSCAGICSDFVERYL